MIKTKSCAKFFIEIILIWIILIVFKGPCPVSGGGSFLQFAPKSTSRPSRPAAFRTLLPFIPKNKNKKSSAMIDFENIQFFVEFLTAYSISKKWTSAQLLFPSPDPRICRYFQVSLLRGASLFTTCQDTLTMSSDSKFQNVSESINDFNKDRTNLKRQVNNTHHQKLVQISVEREPLIACHFLTLLSTNKTARVNVSPKLLINYQATLDILVLGENVESIEKIIDELQPEINTNYKWTLASRLNETHVNIEDVYGLASSSVPLRNYFGVWSSHSGLSIDHQKLMGPTDFKGQLIRVTTVEGQPFVYLHESQGMFQATGYLPDILLSINSRLNFTFQLFPPADKIFGSADDQGNFSGMVGQLQRKEVDLALMSFSYTAARKAVMSFSPPVEYSATRLLIRKDRQTDEINWLAYLDPFEWKVWLAIPLTISLGVFAFLAFSKLKIMKTTPGHSAWLLSLCFLQQGQDDHTMMSAFPGRIVLGSFWILAVVLYSSYTAKITSSLAAVSEKLPLNSLGEVVDNMNWKIGLVKGSSVPDRVKGSQIPEMKKMWMRIEAENSQVSGFKEGIERVYNEKLVFFTSDLIPSFIIKDNASYAWIPGKFFPGFGYMGYQKDLPYAASISNEVAKLRQTGQMKRLFKKWWGDTGDSIVPSTTKTFIGMSLYKTGTAFLVLISGGLLSIVFVLIEFCVHVRKPPEEQQQSLPSQFSASTNSSQISRKQLIENENDSVHLKNNNQKINATNSQQENVDTGFFERLTFFNPQKSSGNKAENSLNLNF